MERAEKRQKIKLRNLDFKEIGTFYEGLTIEKRYIDNPLEYPLGFVSGLRVNGELVGIGGLKRYFWLFQFCFYVVKAKFWGKGLGSKILGDIIVYAINNGYSFLLGTCHKGNTSSMAIFLKKGFRIVYEAGNLYRMGLSLNWKGRIVLKFMPLLFRIYYRSDSLKRAIFLKTGG